MTYNSSSKIVVLAVAGVLTAAQAALAANAVYTYAGMTDGGVNMTLQVGANSDTGLVGELNMTTSTPGFVSPLLTYCTDVGIPLAPTFNYSQTPLSSATGLTPPSWITGGIQNAATLWINDRSGATTAAQTAGLQLAIWELLYNPLAGSYSISTLESSGNGGFFVTSTDANSVAAMTDAVADLNGFSGLPGQTGQASWLAPVNSDGRPSDGSQGLLYMNTPEATSTLALFGMAITALGFANRKFASRKS